MLTYDIFKNFYEPIFNNLTTRRNDLKIPLEGYIYKPEGVENEIVCMTTLDKIWSVLNTPDNSIIIINEYFDPDYEIERGTLLGYLLTNQDHRSMTKIEIVVPV